MLKIDPHRNEICNLDEYIYKNKIKNIKIIIK